MIADYLEMPIAERIGIAGVTEAEWQQLVGSTGDLPAPSVQSCLRRLTYSLPLLRKLLTHGDGADPSAPSRQDAHVN